MYNTILLDLDGTLTDPGVGITNSIMYALKKWNIEVKDRTELYKFIGPPLHESYMKYYNFTEEDSFKAVEDYREYFREKGIYENELYPGIEDMLTVLKAKGKKIVLATSKPEEFAIKILKYFEIYDYFDFIAAASMDGARSKKADVIEYAIKNADIDVKNAVMIGDREYDIFGAAKHNMDSIGVLYGYGNYDELKCAGATHIVEKVENIVSLVK